MESSVVEDDEMRTVFAKSRVLVNTLPVIGLVLIPWAFFSSFALAYSGSVRFGFSTALTWTLQLAALGFVLMAVHSYRFRGTDPSYRPAVAVLGLMNVLAGWQVGAALFASHGSDYYQLQALASVPQLQAESARGLALLDAGSVYLAAGSRIDGDRAMHFRHGTTYCVAPLVTSGSAGAPRTPASGSFDLWVAGRDCCSTAASDFRCGAFADPRARAGLRLLSAGDVSMYRLAVMQAETVFGLRASHPVFFEWVVDPVAEVESKGIALQRLQWVVCATGLGVDIALVLMWLACVRSVGKKLHALGGASPA